MTRITTAAWLLIGVAMWRTPVVLAQQADPPKARFDLGIGALWMGGQPLGTNTATETTGAGGRLTLFNSSSDLASASGVAGRLGLRVTRSIVAEAEAAYLKPQLRIAISGVTTMSDSMAPRLKVICTA